MNDDRPATPADFAPFIGKVGAVKLAYSRWNRSRIRRRNARFSNKVYRRFANPR